VYEVNRENEAIASILGEAKLKKAWIRKLFHLIEKTVPHRLIIMDNSDNEDCHVNLPEKAAPPPEELLALCRKMFADRVKKGDKPQSAIDFVCSVFDPHVSYRIELERMAAEIGGSE
jgi:hypothetical protein